MLARIFKLAVAGISLLAVGVIAKRAYAARRLQMPACDDSIQAVHHGGTRELVPGRIRLIVLHSTEGDTAASAANWFAADASGGSAHLVVDDGACYRTLPDNVVPWGAKGGRVNEDGLHIEMAGHAVDDPKTGAKAYTRDQWLAHSAMLEKAAAIVQNWARAYNVPMVFLTVNDLRAQGENARGITTHEQVTRAFGVDDHMDPGDAFPIDVLMRKVTGRIL